MALTPIPLTTDGSGPAGAKPISLYGVVAGEAAPHTHAAGDIDSGTLAVARIPNLAISKITGLQDKITELEGRLDALEAPAG